MDGQRDKYKMQRTMLANSIKNKKWLKIEVFCDIRDSNTKKLRLNERGTKTQKNVQNYKRMDSRIAKQTAQWSYTHTRTLFQGAKLVRNLIKKHISGKTKIM